MLRKRLTKPVEVAELPKECKPVSGKGVATERGFKLENGAWLSRLTKTVQDEYGRLRRIGLMPRLVPPKILAAAGHPPRSATSCIKAWYRDLEKDRDPATDRGLKRVRELCVDCASTVAAVRTCTIINCPLWAHRMGSNPHNFHKRHGQEG